MVLDVERLGASQASGSQRVQLADSSQPSISLEALSPAHSEATARTPADITIAVTSKNTACVFGNTWSLAVTRFTVSQIFFCAILHFFVVFFNKK